MGNKSALAALKPTQSLTGLLWLLLPMALVLAPHALNMPAWIGLSWLGYAAFSLQSTRSGRKPAGRLIKMVLALGGSAAVLIQYNTMVGPTAGMALLAYLSGAKLLEVDTQRDRLSLLFIGCFLLVGHFIAGQSLAIAGYMAVAAIALVAGMVATQMDAATLADWRPSLKFAARMLIQALPLALLMFLLFPRLQGPLWGMSQDIAGQSGLSDHMSPGDISRLILSDELAFRAEFSGPQPPPQQLYWRGPVLWDYDGREWTTLSPLRGAMPEAEGIGEPVRYSLTLEATHQPWLPLLGLPVGMPFLTNMQSTLGPDLQWTARDPISQRLRYEVRAYPEYLLQPEVPVMMLARGLALPADGNPRARELARGWLDRAPNDAAIVQQALDLFRKEQFFYTLNPPLLGESAVDDFLFTTRRGFCEHYASSFVFLMRAAGVPARVVTGYQGGEANPMGNYLTVRGRDAHAWAEVWLGGRGWVRIDPTAAVAPNRVERGITAALPAGERPGGLVNLDGAWLRPLRMGWDLVNSRWNQWVLGYNQERQRKFLEQLHPFLGHWMGMVWALAVGGGILVLAVAASLWPRWTRARRDPASREYRRFCQALARRGLARIATEAPAEFARRAADKRPDLASVIQRITHLYLEARYGPANPERLRQLREAVAGFRPRPLH